MSILFFARWLFVCWTDDIRVRSAPTLRATRSEHHTTVVPRQGPCFEHLQMNAAKLMRLSPSIFFDFVSSAMVSRITYQIRGQIVRHIALERWHCCSIPSECNGSGNHPATAFPIQYEPLDDCRMTALGSGCGPPQIAQPGFGLKICPLPGNSNVQEQSANRSYRIPTRRRQV
jgi:hypothetical protein